MRKRLVLGMLLATSTAAAQGRDEVSEPATAPVQRWHVTPSFGATSVGDDVGPTLGARALWGFGDIFALGFGGAASRFESERPYRLGPNTFVYGGLMLEIAAIPQARVHPILDLTVGYGLLQWEAERGSGSKSSLVLEPSAGLAVDVTRTMRIGVSATARAGVVTTAHFLGNELGGVGGRLSLSFGRFR